MLKIAWRLITKPEEMWARVVRAKYLRQTTDGWVARSSGCISNLWRGVLRVLHLVEGATSWNIRNGKLVRFWSDRWLANGSILKDLAPNVPEALLQMPVVEFGLNGEWNKDFLNAYLPPSTVLQVLLHPVPTEAEDDVRVWRLTEDGVFSLRIAYAITDMGDAPAMGTRCGGPFGGRQQCSECGASFG
ncbi:unnamed protein product [Linum trigynum]|uniref:Uncharacterized protein n=1 Tax=Linum trigynum TaxID=586398 RepID=A0AAV2F5V4_9ROSI